MKKTELIEAVQAAANLSSKKEAEAAVNAVFDTIVAQVAKGDKIQLVGFGTFEKRERNARTGCDPRTGDKIEIKASSVPAFKAGKAFKDAVNNK